MENGAISPKDFWHAPLFHMGFPPTAIVIWFAIWGAAQDSEDGFIELSRRDLGELLDLSPLSTYQPTKLLEENGFLKVKRSNLDTGRAAPNQYSAAIPKRPSRRK